MTQNNFCHIPKDKRVLHMKQGKLNNKDEEWGKKEVTPCIGKLHDFTKFQSCQPNYRQRDIAYKKIKAL